MPSPASILLFILSMTVVTSSLQVMRLGEGDVVYNSTCFNDDVTHDCRCPEETPTFLQQNCSCVSDSALLTECVQDRFNESNILLEVLFANASQLLNVTTWTNQTRCSVQNFTSLPNQQLPCNFTLTSNNTIQIMGNQQEPVCAGGLYKLHCHVPTGNTTANKCVILKLLNLSQNPSDEICGQPTSTPKAPSSPNTTEVTPTTEELSIWLKYNKLLIYAVVGGGCGIGLVLVFIIMLCVLAGCVASNSRKKARRRRRHLINTAAGSGRGHRHPRASNPHFRQNLTISITNLPDIPETTSADPFEGIVPRDLGVTQVDIPPAQRRDVDDEDDVTFDTFKRRAKQEQSRGAIPEFENQQPKPASTTLTRTTNNLVPSNTPTVPKVSTPSPQPVETTANRGIDIPPPNQTRTQLPTLEIHQVEQEKLFKIAPQVNTPVEEAYYETIALTVEDDTYDNLDHLTPVMKQSIGSLNEYSQLNSFPQNPVPGPQLNHAYSMVTIRTGRIPSSPPPVPPPLSPSYNGLELLGPQNRFSTDILQSSWSKPSMMDQQMGAHSQLQLDTAQDKGSQQLDIYDYPTAMVASAKPPVAARERKKGVVKISTGNTEVIYDVPPSRQRSDGEIHIEHISATKL